MSIRPPSHLLDEQLRQDLDRLSSDDRACDVRVLAHIAEFDARRLYLPAGYRSMFR